MGEIGQITTSQEVLSLNHCTDVLALLWSNTSQYTNFTVSKVNTQGGKPQLCPAYDKMYSKADLKIR